MRFILKVNNQQQDGFSLTTSAENEKEMAVVSELTKLLIEKIKFIEVKVVNYE